MSYIEIKNVSKTYQVGDSTIKALDDISFEINEGELVVILGSSGAGKSTLLNILGGMDKATSGIYRIDNELISDFNTKELTKFRRDYIGFIFQFYNLMPNLNALENVMLSSSLSKDVKESSDIITQVGLKERMYNFPANLSGGEQQRVAIARALVKKPKLLLCDEPTGALDSKTSVEIMNMLQKLNENGQTIIVITHDMNVAKRAKRIVRIADGKLYEEGEINKK